MSVPIIGHGVDLIEVERIERMLDEHGERMLTRVFTAAEREACDGDARRAARYAARFAVKEAALKALGTGLADGITWQDVSVVNRASGAPELVLTGRARELADRQGVKTALVSLSHTKAHAMASVILIGG